MLDGLIGWDGKQQVDRLAPPDFRSPAGSTHAIDYMADGGPRVELRVQALYGLAEHPTVGIRDGPPPACATIACKPRSVGNSLRRSARLCSAASEVSTGK